MSLNFQAIGKRIAKLRKDRGLKQSQLSEIADISANFLSEIERAVTKPSLDSIAKLSEALDISVDYLLFGKEKNRPALESEIATLTDKQKEAVIKIFDIVKEL